MSFRSYRIILLLLIFGLILGITYWEHWAVTQWKKPLEIIIYPINGDNTDQTQAFIKTLSASHFQEISRFIDQQSQRYFLQKRPSSTISLGAQIKEIPPTAPAGTHSTIDTLLWSLKLRYYAFHHTRFFASLGKVRLFVIYHAGEDGIPLQHSLGLKNGLFGIVHVFARAEQERQNNLVITHELLHALGATDKYDENLMPVYPEGFGDPGEGPRFPQRLAEIMAGRIARSPTQAIIPESLDACVIGHKSAHEINW